MKQRVSLRYHLQPLNQEETKEFIGKRLRVAGIADPHLFTPKALKEIYRYSKGIPRLINIVCDNALLTGYAIDQKVIGPKIILEVIDHLEGTGKKRKLRRSIFFATVLMIFLTFGISSYVLWKESFPRVRWEIVERVQSLGKMVEKVYEETLGKYFR